MRVHLDLFPPNRNSDGAHSEHQFDVFSDSQGISGFATTSSILHKETAMKGMKRCASNLSAARELPFPSETESFSFRSDVVPDDRRTTPPLSQEILHSASSQHAFTSSRFWTEEARTGNLRNGDVLKTSTAVALPGLHAESSTTSCRRLLTPQKTCAHKIISIERRLTESTPMSAIPMKMTRHFGHHGFSHFDGTHHGHGMSRPRSKSIMIKQSRGHDDADQLDNSAERIYDWATWRMYHRITSARRSRASVTPIINKVPSPATVVHNKPMDDCLPNRPDGSHNMERSLASIDYSQDGEVFEIDDI